MLIRALDISGLFYPSWHKNEAKGASPREASDDVVRALRERGRAAGADYVVACCDAGRTFRDAIAAEYRETVPDHVGYKGHRKEKDGALMAALDRVIEEMEADGVPIFRAAGFEADDVIATLTKWAVDNGFDVEIVSDDKDLLSLVRDANPDDDAAPSVVVVRRDGTRQDFAACVERMGVPPQLVPELLALCGDTSDAVAGIPGIGKKTGAALLWGEWEGDTWKPTPFRRFSQVVDAAIDEQAAWEKHACYRVHEGARKGATHEQIAKRVGIPAEDVPKYLAREKPEKTEPEFRFASDVRRNLIAYAAHYDIGLRLTRLRTDVPIDFATVTAPRVPKPRENGFQIDGYPEEDEDEMSTGQTTNSTQPPSEPLPPMRAVDAAPPSSVALVGEVVTATPQTIEQPQVVIAPPPRAAETAIQTIQQVTDTAIEQPRGGAYSLSLDPRDFREARMLAKDIADSRIFSKIKTPQEALALILTGREYGLPAMASIRLLHLIEGQVAIHAQIKIGLAMKSRRVEYMNIKEWKTDGENSFCVWEGKRRDRSEPNVCKYGVADAKLQQLVKPNSNWVKMPAWMSMVRAGANLATMLIPDEMAGLYTFDEMGAAEVVLGAQAA